MSTLGASRVSSAVCSIPEYGTARADVLLTAGVTAPASGPASLTLADLSLSGTILSADLDAPDLPRAVWVNGAGWDLPLPGRSYGTDAGVRLRTILTDLIADVNAAATAAGWASERWDAASLPADAPVGALELRTEGTTGRDVLGLLHRAGLVPPWWVHADGSTHFGARPSGPGTGRATVMRRNASLGLRVFGLDSPAGWLPGTSLEGVVTRRLVVHERARSLTAHAYSRAVPTIRDSVAAIAERDRPELRYAYPRTFVVRAVHSDGRIDLDPPHDAPDLRPLNNVEQWTLGGALAYPSAGASVLVMFRDARESRAVVVGFAPSAPGPEAARVGDTAGELYQDTATGLVYYAPTSAGVYAPIASGVGPPPLATPGTAVTIATGSSAVKVGP